MNVRGLMSVREQKEEEEEEEDEEKQEVQQCTGFPCRVFWTFSFSINKSTLCLAREAFVKVRKV